MDLINALINAKSLQLKSFSCDYRVDTSLPAPTRQGHIDQAIDRCLPKDPGALYFNIDSAAFGFPGMTIVFLGSLQGADTDGNPIVTWTVQAAPGSSIAYPTGSILVPVIHFNTVSGSLATVLHPYQPAYPGESCDGSAGKMLCFFEDHEKGQYTFEIDGEHNTKVTVSNISLFCNVLVAPSITGKISSVPNHSSECSGSFDLAGEQVKLSVNTSTTPAGDHLTYLWSVDKGSISGPSTNATVHILLPDDLAAGDLSSIIHVQVEVTDTETGFIGIFTAPLRYFPGSYTGTSAIICALRRLIQEVYPWPFIIDPWGPVEAIFNSSERLSAVLRMTKELQSLIQQRMKI